MSNVSIGFGAKWEIWDDTNPTEMLPMQEFFYLKKDAEQRCRELNDMERLHHFCIKWFPYRRKKERV